MERNDFDKWLFEILQKKLKRQPSDEEFEKFSNKMTIEFEKLRTALEPWVKDIKKYTTKIERDANYINEEFGFKPDAKHFSEIVMNEFSADEIDAMMFSDPAPHIMKYIKIYRKKLKKDYTQQIVSPEDIHQKFKNLFRTPKHADEVIQIFENHNYTSQGKWIGITHHKTELLAAYHSLKPKLKGTKDTPQAIIFYHKFGLDTR